MRHLLPVPALFPAIFLGCFLAVLPGYSEEAAVKVWVTLKDKGPALPKVLTGHRAYEDAPVYPPYLEQLREAGFEVGTVLKWQNRVSGWIAPERLRALRRLAAVTAVEGMPRKAPAPSSPGDSASHRPGFLSKRAAAAFGLYQTLFDTLQVSRLRTVVDSLGQKPGQGVKVAVIDAGFYLGQGAFDTLRAAGRIRDQWDFVANRPGAVHDSIINPFDHQAHGGMVLSTIAAQGYGYEGLVPQATFLLYRAEDGAQETYVEEDYVAAAIERAVDSGAQVINISLGYRYDFSDNSPDYTYAMMNGRTRPASLAALGAARRNVLLSVSMGNNAVTHPGGPSLSSPADADSILSVGFLDFRSHRPCDYSSGGPTADGRVKPDIASTGMNAEYYCLLAVVPPWAAGDPGENASNPSGTSFAAPVITGIAALLRQLHPAASAQAIRAALIGTAERAANPDSGSGYGLARAWAAHLRLVQEKTPPVAMRPPRPVPARARVSIARDVRGRTVEASSAPGFHAGPSLPAVRE